MHSKRIMRQRLHDACIEISGFSRIIDVVISDSKLRKSQLQLRWETLLSGDQIWQWVYFKRTSEIPKEPGTYRWIFPAADSKRSIAYVGEAEVLSKRIARYLNAGNQQLYNAKESETTDRDLSERELRRALRDNHKIVTLRNGVRLARICENCTSESCSVKLERLRIDEEGAILGIEINANLFADKIGRAFLESLSILQMEQQGYRIDNRNRSAMAKELATKLPALKGARGS